MREPVTLLYAYKQESHYTGSALTAYSTEPEKTRSVTQLSCTTVVLSFLSSPTIGFSEDWFLTLFPDTDASKQLT